MGGHDVELTGYDFEEGIPVSELGEEPILGHAFGEPILMIPHGDRLAAVSATCTHYGGPLSEGTVFDGKVFCPWHHAGFDLETGAAEAPGLDPVSCYDVSYSEGKMKVTGRKELPEIGAPSNAPDNVVIVGSGAAGSACAEELRRQGYQGIVRLIGSESNFAVDRPNLSKDYLAGEAPEEWLAVRDEEWFADHGIDWIPGEVERIDVDGKELWLTSGRTVHYDALVLATGARARPLPVDGGDLPHVHTLREVADAKALAAAAEAGSKAVVVGASFIGLEAAASLRHRDLEVHVVAPEAIPLGRILGDELGKAVQAEHESNGTKFHLESGVEKIEEGSVTLSDGTKLDADLVVVGIGVIPRTELAEAAGLNVDNGITVTSGLQATQGVWAIGDIARFPTKDGSARIEHWVVARRQGQFAARNICGRAETYDDVPFFWSAHGDLVINYVGHAKSTEDVRVAGSLADKDATISYWEDGVITAVATIGRDVVSLEAEHLMSSGDQEGLAELVSK